MELYAGSYDQLTLNDNEYPTKKRSRQDINDTDTSDDEEKSDVNPTHSSMQLKFKFDDSNRDNSLDLGDDQMDYKTSTISKHHSRY